MFHCVLQLVADFVSCLLLGKLGLVGLSMIFFFAENSCMLGKKISVKFRQITELGDKSLAGFVIMSKTLHIMHSHLIICLI